ncbi:pyridoxal kinase [Lachnospiraceae bacterium KM106-2]|nr:pyridoxal kinase [Lachnospiraceae bacterium KM106-2]
MERQKRVLVINDLSSYGRCALTVSMPILSAMGIETCPLPTALLSTNGAFRGHVMVDQTNMMEQTLRHFKELELSFDAILIGLLTNTKQADLIEDFLKAQKGSKPFVILDPIMGDHGKLYSVTKKEVSAALRKLVAYADVITPNLTEVCELLEIPYESNLTSGWLKEQCERLRKLGAKEIVITGIPDDNKLINYIATTDGKLENVVVEKVGNDRCGTGDVFSSVLTGCLLHQKSLFDAVEAAADFLVKTIEYSNACHSPEKNGVCFESFLAELSHKYH